MSSDIIHKLKKYRLKSMSEPNNELYLDKLKYYQMLNLVVQNGGKQEMCSVSVVKKYQQKIIKNRKRLEHLGPNTNSFIPRNKIPATDTIYMIHDNGGRPFKVVVNKKSITVYTYQNDDNKFVYDIKDYTVPIFETTKFLGYWYGYDTSIYQYDGNTIMIQVQKHKYICIGTEIYSFETNEVITDFIAHIGNNDVPYPVAYSDNYVYFRDQKINKNNLMTIAIAANANQMYSEYYGHIFPKDKNYKPKIEKVKKFKIIQKRL